MKQLYALQRDLDMLIDDVKNLKKGYGSLDYIVKMVRDFDVEQLAIGAQLKRVEDQLLDFKNDMRRFKDSFYAFKEEMYQFKDDMYAFRDEFYQFRNEMLDFKAEMYGFKDEMKVFKAEMYQFRDEFYKFKDEMHEFKTNTERLLILICKKLDINPNEVAA